MKLSVIGAGSWGTAIVSILKGLQKWPIVTFGSGDEIIQALY